MAKLKNALGRLKEMLGLEKPRTAQPKSIMERLEGLIPPVEKIRDSYKVDQQVAEAGHRAMVAVEEMILATLIEQRQSIRVQELLIEQQVATGDIIDVQHYKALDAETIINNLREWLLGDDLTIAWMLENGLVPAFGRAFARQTPERQRTLFAELRVAVNSLQKIDGMLAEPGFQRGRMASGEV